MAKSVTASRKGDMVEFNGGDYRLERVVITEPGAAVHDDGAGTFKLFRKVDNETKVVDGEETLVNADGDPTTYTYRYDVVGEFTAADDDAAETEAKRLIAGS